LFSFFLFVVGASYGNIRPIGYRMQSVWTKYILETWFSRRSCIWLTGACAVFCCVLIGLGVPLGKGIDATFSRPALRPLLNLWAVIIPITILITMSYALRSSRHERRVSWPCAALCVCMGFLTGQRAVSLVPIATALVCYMSAYRPRQVLIPLLAAPALIVVAMLAYSIRTGASITPERFWGYIVAQMCFGNQFSDLRDFAWILSRFNGEWLMGKTYAAGYTPFLPSMFSPFRMEFGWGRWSSAIVGLDPSHHGGLRAGIFGEVYFNFGMIGLVIICPFIGWIIGSIFCNGARWARNKPKNVICASAVVAYIMAQLVMDIIFTTSFYQVLVILILLGLVGLLQWIGRHGRGPRGAKVSYGRNQAGRDVRAPRIARQSHSGESA